MTQSPFTPKDVADKLNELYALSDTALALQADAVETNFKLWFTQNFLLSSAQLTFLAGIDDPAARYYGQQCSICFQHRLDIELIYPDPPTSPGYAKWPVSSNTIKIEVDGTGQVIASGKLTFTITYK